jgi:hypothetical protein
LEQPVVLLKAVYRAETVVKQKVHLARSDVLSSKQQQRQSLEDHSRVSCSTLMYSQLASLIRFSKLGCKHINLLSKHPM